MTVLERCFVLLSSIDQTTWLTALSTAVLVVVIGGGIAMLVASENRQVEELSQGSQRQQKPAQTAGPSEGSR